MEKTGITVIGSGVIGLAVSHLLSAAGKEVTVIEKNPSFGQEASSRNSEVIHAGLYYPKGSLKARTCIRGKELLHGLCSKHKITCKRLGKLIVVSRKEDMGKLDAIRANAASCGVKNLSFLDKKGIRELEPVIEGESALFSPDTGILDSHGLMQFFLTSAKEKGASFTFSVEVKGIRKKRPGYEVTVKEPSGDLFSFETGVVINCAGLEADKVAALVGIDPDKNFYRIHYCKGRYFRVRNPRKFPVNHLVYPPPTEASLGVHITPDLAGGLRLGPDAQYVNEIDYTVDEHDKEEFLNSARELLPNLQPDDIIPDTAGIRAKLSGSGEGFRDFVIRDEADKGFPKFINLIGIESPGLTSSLAIAEIVKDMV
ncbi:MAG: NAD(P)/FAD-dependent oxidoreductase [Omnitrophica bacterium]|nr:NAD(P)/FAD-dependent oxidoreductase [Candidatus Omnitrophota bacterium]